MRRDRRSRSRPGRAIRAALAAAGFLLAAHSARAVGGCSFVVATGVSFGNYDALVATPLDQTGSITFNCDLLFLQTLTIDLSHGNSGTYAFREMRKSGGMSLRYNLYLDAARTQIWGDGTGGSAHFGPFLPTLNFNHTVTMYGRVPARQASPVGAYTDTITVTINY
jgi:spore coat protein U-like protein